MIRDCNPAPHSIPRGITRDPASLKLCYNYQIECTDFCVKLLLNISYIHSSFFESFSAYIYHVITTDCNPTGLICGITQSRGIRALKLCYKIKLKVQFFVLKLFLYFFSINYFLRFNFFESFSAKFLICGIRGSAL